MKPELAHRDGLADGCSSIIYRLAKNIGTDIRTVMLKKTGVSPIVPHIRVRSTISFLNTHTSSVSTPTTWPCTIQLSTTISLTPQSPNNNPFLSLLHLHRRYSLLSALPALSTPPPSDLLPHQLDLEDFRVSGPNPL